MKAPKTRLSLLLTLTALITMLLLLQRHTAEAVAPPPTLTGEIASYPPTPGSLVVTPTGPPCTTYSFTVTTTVSGPYQGTFTATGTFTLEPITPDPMTPNITHRVVEWTETFTINQPVSAIPPQPVAHVITGTKQLDPTANTPAINVAHCSATQLNPSPVYTTYQATITGDDGTFTDSGTAQGGIIQLLSTPGAESFFESFISGQAQTTPVPAACTRIAFATNRDGNYEIYVMNPDGSGQTNLTNNPATDIHPAWSPDGTKLAFATNRDGNYEIYVMNADGSNSTQLTTNTANDYQPDWSPDGTKLAFMSERDGTRQVYVMNADGTSQTNLSNNLSKSDELPRWSPDGGKIAFSRSLGADGNGEVYVMNADGTNQVNLTNNFAAVDSPMDWSPDGAKLLISSNRADLLTYELYLINADGSGSPTRLTNNTDNELFASWSPDGAKIAFDTTRDSNLEIYVMNADGSNPTRLTSNGNADTYPAWGVCAPAPTDTDGDGVLDSEDNCPTTANPGQEDVDGDDVGDACDQCPTDPAKIEPGSCGCGLPDTDSDADGTPDCNDQCPSDPAKIDPGSCGCGVPDTDTDGDGTPDCNDPCPDDPNKTNPGACGCGVPDTDSDNDGTPDCLDQCPSDADKTAPGACGCGSPETDSDGDGTPDCNDQCPSDPGKTAPGVCGCGVADADTDLDGIADCLDNCPSIANPDQRDINGDGVGDACTPFQFPAGGIFVIGDQVNLSHGATVYFWGSQWSKHNPMSGATAPNAFKGFESGSAQAACGGQWTSQPGNSSNPPQAIPEYMAVIVSSSIQRDGSVLSGDIKAIVVVRTLPDYGPSPGHSGTGQVVAILCGATSLPVSLLDSLINSQESLAALQGQRWFGDGVSWSSRPGSMLRGERGFGLKPLS